MIIVKTKNGDIFLDDKEYFYLEHIKSERRIKGKRKNAELDLCNVESVRYVSDAEAIDYTDKGSEVEKLQKQVGLLTMISDTESDLSTEFRYLYIRAYEFVVAIAEAKEAPTDGWERFVEDAKKVVDDVGKISELKIGPFSERLDILYKELKDVTKDGSV